MKKAEIRKLDKLFSQLIRSKGYCEKCGARNDTLQCCHIFSRSKRSVRWTKLNALCLCAKCHWWAHLNPILFTEFVRQHLGKTRYELLKTKARKIKPYLDYETIKYSLEGGMK